MNFIKMHGLGNDFVILDHRKESTKLSAEQITHICDRHFGVGCDQLIVLEPSSKADLFMRIYNPDGSQAEACGNATRCAAHIYMSETNANGCTVETLRGVLACTLIDENRVQVDMGAPMDIKTEDTAHLPAPTPPQGITVNMGNPHVVFFVDDTDAIPLEQIGPTIEHDSLFPDRANVEFVHKKSDGSFRLRVWERGAGITLACGSGACAAAVAAIQNNNTQSPVNIEMDGGVLELSYKEGGSVFMTGPVAYVFKGQLSN